MESIQKQLEELGLSQNEVKAYLAALELGPATVLQIAAKAAIVRPTAHVAIGGLVKRGLMSSHTRGKKHYYQAERPGQLMRLIEEEKKRLADRETMLKSMVPGLESLQYLTDNKPEVKYYEGLEGLESMRDILLKSKAKQFDGIAGSLRKYRETVPEESRILYALRAKNKGIKGRQIIIPEDGKTSLPLVSPDKWEYRIANKSLVIPTSAEIGIFENYVSIIVFRNQPFGVLIKDKDVTNLVRVMFECFWRSCKKI